MQFLTLSNDPLEMRRMSGWVREQATALGAGPGSVGDLELCANEAVANVLSYAWEHPGPHEVVLRILRDGDTILLEVEDDGIPFDPLAFPDPGSPRDLDEATIGGLGIRLIRRLMPASGFERRNGRNVLMLRAPVR